MPETLTPDICVIGAGAAGLSVAAAAAAFGVPVVLIEKGRMGGDCLNVGCVPSKALIAAARHAAAMKEAQRFGIKTASSVASSSAVRDATDDLAKIDFANVDFAKVRAHVRGVIAAIAPNDSAARFAGLGVRVITGTARFVDKDTVAVDDGTVVKARRFVIATGSVPAMPPIDGLGGAGAPAVPYLTNETIFDLDTLPAHLAVIGGGPIGLELAQAFRRLGSAVTVFEAATPLAKDDPECARVVLDALAREGVAIRSAVTVTAVRAAAGGGVAITFGAGAGAASETVAASHLLVAAGRRADLAGFGLAAAGIEHGPGGVLVDRGLRTTNRRVYAIGDAVAGGPQFTHVASHQASLVIRNALFRLPARMNRDLMPWVTYTDPELAQVGLTEPEARRRGLEFNVLRWPYHDNDRAQADRTTRGHIKVLTTRRGRILGATIVGAQAGELIAVWSLALSRRMNVRALAGTVLPYPTLAEIGRRAAVSFFLPRLTSPMLRRIIGWLRRLG